MQSNPTRMWPLWLLASALILMAGMVHAAGPAPDWSTFNHQAVQQHILPRYAQLDSSTARLAASTEALCQAPSIDTLEQARRDWHDAMQAWQGIQHVQFGPVQFLMRSFGLQFWPDRKNIGARQLRQALTSEQPYDAEFFRQASVSIQGFPALERLLFADDALEHLQRGRHCELTRTIAGHVAQMSHAIHSEWQAQASGEFTADQDTDIAAELAVELMASLVEPIEAVRDSKLLKPMGDTAAAARPKLLESYRSGSSLANIRSNLAALDALYQGTEPSVDDLLQQAGAAELAEAIRTRFATIQHMLSQIDIPLSTAITQPDTHAELMAITTQLKQLSEQLDSAMDVLGIQLGFNSRDGD